jgi:hypothetical protein
VAENGYTGSQIYYDGKHFASSDCNSIQEAVSLIVKLRRIWILNKLIKFKIIRENKQLKNYNYEKRQIRLQGNDAT